MGKFDPKFKNLVQIFEASMRAYADRPLFGVKTSGEWVWSTYRTFGERVDAFRAGLKLRGVEPGDRVAIIANNCPEWAIAAYASYGLGAAFVPMYEAQHDKEWKFILRDCGAKVLIVAEDAIRARVDAFRSEVPALERIVVIRGSAGGDAETFEALEAAGKGAPTGLVDPKDDDIAGFIYTSGTTGNPKGVLLSHRNLAANVSAIHAVFPLTPDDRSLAFLPWAHSFGQTVELHGLLSMGASIAIAEAVDKIVDNLAEVQPTVLYSVPRIFNRIYDGLHKRMAEDGGMKKVMFEAAMANATERKRLAGERKTSGWAELKHSVFDKLVFSKVRARFGGQLKYAFSGGAALSQEVAEFIDDLGIMVYEGYGLTETSPIATANYPGARRIGSVGKPIPGVTVEIDRAATGDAKHGEIVVYGHNVMQGYHGLEEENRKVLVQRGGERGFRTGDMGFKDDNGFVYISGRIKEQYKLLNGKYVVPTPLEETLKLSPYISNVMVHGQNQEFNVALIIPDFETLEKWAEGKALPSDRDALVRHPKVVALFEEELAKHSEGFKSFERCRKLVLGTEDFSPENGMLTPTLKLKRRVVLQHYGEMLDAAFEK